MEQYEMGVHFPFNEIRLDEPIGLQGGAYLSRIRTKRPCLLQTPPILLKSGITLQSDHKRGHIDVMWDKRTDDGKITNEFMNQFEKNLREQIYLRREQWFDGDVDKEDIDYFFQSALKTYQTHYDVMRVLLMRLSKTTLREVSDNNNNQNDGNTNKAREYGVRIFDEEDRILDIADIQTNVYQRPVILIIEPYGVKFSSTSFHVVYYLRQIMVLQRPDETLKPILNECLIRRNRSSETIVPTQTLSSSSPVNDIEEPEKQEEEQETDISMSHKTDNIDTTPKEHTPSKDSAVSELDMIEDIDVEELIIDQDTLPSISLKQPNQVYYEMYQEARRKAQEARQQALDAYLEAKHIRHTYQLMADDDLDKEFQQFAEMSS